jgi:kynureninase
VVRLAPIPLYTSYWDVWTVVQHLKAIIDNGEYEKFSQERSTVT